MNLKIVQVVGLNTDQKAAQVISNSQDGDNSFLAVLDLSSDDAFTNGRQFLSEISDFYFEAEGSPSEKLTTTFNTANEKLNSEEFSLIVAAISGKILYFIASGEIEIYLKREDKLSSLLSVGNSAQLISGFLQEGDKLLFSTKSLIKFLGDDLQKSLNLTLPEFEEEITDRIGASNLENESLAGLMAEVEQEQFEQQAKGVEGEAIPDLSETSFKEDRVKSRFNMAVLAELRRFIPKSGKGRLILALVLIAVIGLGIGYRFKVAKDVQKQAAFNQVLQGAKVDFNAAKGLAALNPPEAKNKLDSSKNKLNRALAINPKDSQALDLKKQIDQESGSILQQSQVSDFPVFLDLDLIKKNFRTDSLSLSAGKLLLLDPAAKTLVIIDIAKKNNQILAGAEQLGDAQKTTLNGSSVFVYSKDKGILKVDTGNQKTTTVSKKDDDWGQIGDIYGFGGNVYLLDKGSPSTGSGQIWKYLPASEGFSDKREYLTKDTKADFSNALRIQIESSVYILKSGGEILRFTRGAKDNFGLEGLEKWVKDPKSIFVSSDTDNFYIMDSGNSRLLILTKTGGYKGQIQGDKFGTATDLVVDEKKKKVYLLEGSKIYSVDLK